MKAYTRSTYGGPEILSLNEVDRPKIKGDHLLVKVYANAANPADWHLLRGDPFIARFSTGLFKPKHTIPGADFSGVVIETGENVSRYKVGDKVFGETLMGGAFAEYVSVPEKLCALMPANKSFTEMASVPIAGLTALQALITHGKLQSGETVLINGASGGVGHFAVQIANAYGAKITGVCSSRNIDFVKSLGAYNVIAYDKENIHHHKGSYDLVIDVNGNLFHKDFKRMGKRGVVVGFTTLGHMFSLLLQKASSKFPLNQFTAKANAKDLETLATLMGEGKITPHIERVYSYKEIPAALSYIETMRTRGKVVMKWMD